MRIEECVRGDSRWIQQGETVLLGCERYVVHPKRIRLAIQSRRMLPMVLEDPPVDSRAEKAARLERD